MLYEDKNINQLLSLTRESDIINRGSQHKVYDYDGKVVKLIDAKIWYSNDGNYVEPRSYNNDCLCNSCTIC